MTTNPPGDFGDPMNSQPQSERGEEPIRFSPPPVVLSEPEFVDPESFNRFAYDEFRKSQRKRLLLSVALFFATFASTFLVGSGYASLQLLPAYVNSDYRNVVDGALRADAERRQIAPKTISDILWETTVSGLEYAVPLMLILLFHEMGHYLQSVRYRIPASFPFFIPLPLPPLGTMGAVILQGRGHADRKQMFDIAVSGPLAGLAVTIPVLCYGITQSTWIPKVEVAANMQLGEPLLLTWMIQWLKPAPAEGMEFMLNGYAFAGWVGVFITAMNLLPVGQLDGGHILYTLIGKHAHKVALITIGAGAGLMILSGIYSYSLLLILLLMTGVMHPPTANDRVSIGWFRHVVGWLTLAFLIVGFTPQPIMIPGGETELEMPEKENRKERIDPSQVDPNDVVEIQRANGTGLAVSPQAARTRSTTSTAFRRAV